MIKLSPSTSLVCPSGHKLNRYRLYQFSICYSGMCGIKSSYWNSFWENYLCQNCRKIPLWDEEYKLIKCKTKRKRCNTLQPNQLNALVKNMSLKRRGHTKRRSDKREDTLKLTLNTLERTHWPHSSFVFYFEQNSHIVLVFLLLAFNNLLYEYCCLSQSIFCTAPNGL